MQNTLSFQRLFLDLVAIAMLRNYSTQQRIETQAVAIAIERL